MAKTTETYYYKVLWPFWYKFDTFTANATSKNPESVLLTHLVRNRKDKFYVKKDVS